ncbi:hypothetical protein G7046_g8163 [Stylonectria norvegica]|nr:hypothetical protein G7046_g8163 [Stylonectria norvegica]
MEQLAMYHYDKDSEDPKDQAIRFEVVGDPLVPQMEALPHLVLLKMELRNEAVHDLVWSHARYSWNNFHQPPCAEGGREPSRWSREYDGFTEEELYTFSQEESDNENFPIVGTVWEEVLYHKPSDTGIGPFKAWYLWNVNPLPRLDLGRA